MHTPRPQEIYRHFKGRLYQVITIARHSETGEEMVVYQAMYGDFAVYVRPLWMFTETLDVAKYPDADQTYRFQHVRPLRDEIRTRPDKPSVPRVLGGQKRAAYVEEEDDFEEDYEEQTSHNHSSGGRRSGRESGVMQKTIEEEAKELGMDPRVVMFLDADSPEKRLQILDELHHDITDDQIDICAMAVDAKIPAGDIYDRYAALRDVLMTRQRFESNRLRS